MSYYDLQICIVRGTLKPDPVCNIYSMNISSVYIDNLTISEIHPFMFIQVYSI